MDNKSSARPAVEHAPRSLGLDHETLAEPGALESVPQAAHPNPSRPGRGNGSASGSHMSAAGIVLSKLVEYLAAVRR